MKKDTILDEFELVMGWIEACIKRGDLEIEMKLSQYLFGFLVATECFDSKLSKRLSQRANTLIKNWHKQVNTEEERVFSKA